MDAAKAKKFLPIISAFAEGKTLQINCGTANVPDWRDTKHAVFDGHPDDYRIKPAPVVVHVVLNGNHRVVDTFVSYKLAKATADEFNKWPLRYQNHPYTAHTLTEDKS